MPIQQALASAQQNQRFQLACGLTELPSELFGLADTLEILDLSNNQLKELPADFGRFTKLRILFLSNNQFTQVPQVLADCPKLEMIAFKNNHISELPEDALPIDTRWLILTDNQLSHLPNSMGKLHRLQKLALGGNQLTALPASMRQCKNLELARFSANQLHAIPDWLLQLPKLSWLAFAGNNIPSRTAETCTAAPHISLADIQLGEQLGEGASGLIYRGEDKTGNNIAVKIFKGEITSDGYPKDELNCCLQAGEHNNLIKAIGQIDENKKLGLVMELIPPRYYNLGQPPSLASCTRDTFATGTAFNLRHILSIASQMAGTLQHLHSNQISHGDAYAHNTMIDAEANVLFGDFGAATDLSALPEQQQLAMEKVEVRAFGCLLDDLLSVSEESADKTLSQALNNLTTQCMQAEFEQRPRFSDIQQQLSQLA